MKYKFYDTCSLLEKASNLWTAPDEQLVVSSITLEELENIKTSVNKDANIKYTARKLVKELYDNYDKIEIVFWTDNFITNYVFDNRFKITNDLKIVLCALDFFISKDEKDCYFITNDICCRTFAKFFLPSGITVEDYRDEPYDYLGYKEIQMDDDEMAYFYNNLEENKYGLITNEYLIVKDKDGNIVDKMCWTGERFRPVQYYTFNSSWFGDVKPFKGDVYQVFAFDSLMNNKITMLKGKSGSGKSFAALSFLFHKLERGRIDKIIVFCNTVAANNAAKLGFYPGTKNDKLLDSQIGNLLSAKLGSQMAVQHLIDDEKLVLVPLADIRGYDTSGMNAGVYITEAQNMDTELMKLALQRIGEDCICIIDGDFNAQVDMVEYAGANNGMRRASKVLRGNDIYGEITLNTIHRSRIAELAEQI